MPVLTSTATELGTAAAAIGEQDEVFRVTEFLYDSSPEAAAALPPIPEPA